MLAYILIYANIHAYVCICIYRNTHIYIYIYIYIFALLLIKLFIHEKNLLNTFIVNQYCSLYWEFNIVLCLLVVNC